MEGFCPLASGSKGNCTYVGTRRTKLLIDAGISARRIEGYLGELGVALEEIDAILISHEHGDHIQGLKTLALKKGIPVLANSETAKAIATSIGECPTFHIFTTGETFVFGDLHIHPFSIQHDTVDPVAFTLQCDDLKLGFCTDLGFATSLVKSHLSHADYLVLEANHHIPMVHACSRPMVYKTRVLGRNGHLSNDACANLLAAIAHTDLKHVHLAHLSSECNTHEKALSVVSDTLTSHGITLDLSIAYQEKLSWAILF